MFCNLNNTDSLCFPRPFQELAGTFTLVHASDPNSDFLSAFEVSAKPSHWQILTRCSGKHCPWVLLHNGEENFILGRSGRHADHSSSAVQLHTHVCYGQWSEQCSNVRTLMLHGIHLLMMLTLYSGERCLFRDSGQRPQPAVHAQHPWWQWHLLHWKGCQSDLGSAMFANLLLGILWAT